VLIDNYCCMVMFCDRKLKRVVKLGRNSEVSVVAGYDFNFKRASSLGVSLVAL
jgi:hypothetical protein